VGVASRRREKGCQAPGEGGFNSGWSQSTIRRRVATQAIPLRKSSFLPPFGTRSPIPTARALSSFCYVTTQRSLSSSAHPSSFSCYLNNQTSLLFSPQRTQAAMHRPTPTTPSCRRSVVLHFHGKDLEDLRRHATTVVLNDETLSNGSKPCHHHNGARRTRSTRDGSAFGRCLGSGCGWRNS
jgi:hypothetical protein